MVTREGQVAALLLVGFAAGAINTGTNLLFAILGLITSLLVLEARRTRRALRGLEAAREHPRAVVRGEPARVTVGLRAADGARRALPFLLEERDPGRALDRTARVLLWEVGSEPARASWEAVFLRRGRVELGALLVTCRGACGLVEARREVAAEGAVLVLPRLRRLRATATLLGPPSPAERRPRPLGPERRDVVRALRELRPGDDPRTIHWRATARRGELVVREFERAGPEGALVLLDLAGPTAPGVDGDPDPARQEAEAVQEAAVELALALVGELLRRGEPAGLGLAGGGAPLIVGPGGPGVLTRVREALALATPAPDPDLGGLLRAAGRQARDLRLILVTTRSAGEARARLGGATPARLLEVHQEDDAEAWLVPLTATPDAPRAEEAT